MGICIERDCSKSYRHLFVDRGPPGGNMTTNECMLVVKTKNVYEIAINGLRELAEREIDWKNVINLEKKVIVEQTNRRGSPPPHAKVDAKWPREAFMSGLEGNIFPQTGILRLDKNILNIPVALATPENLSWFMATAVKKGTQVQFSDLDSEPDFPIFGMTTGKDYITKYIMESVPNGGGGFYVEFHNDKPHFHMHTDETGGGYYILGRFFEGKLCLAAFQIPYDKAIYTGKGAIHCDAALKGNMVVGYDTSEDYSTVLLRGLDGNEMVSVNFVENSQFFRETLDQ